MNSRVLFHLLRQHSCSQGCLASSPLFCICAPYIPTLRAQTSCMEDNHTLNTAVFIQVIMEISIVSVSDCLTFVGLLHCLHSSVHVCGEVVVVESFPFSFFPLKLISLTGTQTPPPFFPQRSCMWLINSLFLRHQTPLSQNAALVSPFPFPLSSVSLCFACSLSSSTSRVNS